ncbi:MAG: GGDEF-domain containing protein, partial [Noviherbaspirillum sp.]|nr:GGDEF-domain containing protein [Noviherbaspirillum sp.]
LALSRSQNVVSAAAIAGISDPFYALFYYMLGFRSATPVILLCGAFMVSAPFLLKLTGRIKIAEEVFVCAVYCNFCWLTYHLGGVEAPTAAWLIICPVVAMLLGGVATGIFWLVMSCAAVVGIYLLEVAGVQLPASPIEDPLLLQSVCGIGLFVVVVIFVLFFELTKTQGFIKLEQALKIIQELAIRDELTGTFNRRHLLKLIEDEKDRADRLATSFCVCLLDIDHFKRINDTYGHSAGDVVLRTFAHAVEGNIRGIDSFGRYGGEEFLLMLPETDLDQALALAERVRIETERIDFADVSDMLTVTVSIGIARYQSGENVTLTITRADQALYKAKASGRNRSIRHSSPDMLDKPIGGGFAEQMIGITEFARAEAIALNQKQIGPESSFGIPVEIHAADGRERGETEWRQASLAHYDPMTGLPNRHIFRDRLSHAMHRATRHNLMLALVTLDINKFKELNNALGYEKGDEALIKVAERIKKCLRECDTVSRWDGDEFSIILEDVIDENGVHVVAQKIIEEFYEPMVLGETECFLTLSIGVVLFPDHDRDIDGLFKKADVAMLRAKSAGQNIYRIYSSDMSRVSIDPLTLKSELRHALFRGELFLQYQPQVDIVTHTIIGVEALIRWNHPQLGFITPNQFIPFAEETGLIIPIGEWVLRTACIQSRQWRDAGLPTIKIAVNLSARQLKHPELAAHVRAIITETGVDPATVELEITEGLLIDNLHRSKEVISELRSFGIKISIDDFGTGYSSLSYLSELPLDILKMDGSFVKRLDNSSSGENSYSIADAIISMAHNMDLKVIAEAVETEEQLECLRKMKCDQMQGYLYSRPVQPSEIAEMLERQIVKKHSECEPKQVTAATA